MMAIQYGYKLIFIALSTDDWLAWLCTGILPQYFQQNSCPAIMRHLAYNKFRKFVKEYLNMMKTQNPYLKQITNKCLF